MVWNAAKPAGADKIKDSDDNIRANNDAIETVLGTNITAGPTTIQGAIQGDATKGRKFRNSRIAIANGTNGVSLKCTVISLWNGDTIGVTDDIIKDATTGNFSLNAAGTILTIEASGLTGNVVGAFGVIIDNASGTVLTTYVFPSSNDIVMSVYHASTAALQDLTTLVDTGTINIDILYITDA